MDCPPKKVAVSGEVAVSGGSKVVPYFLHRVAIG